MNNQVWKSNLLHLSIFMKVFVLSDMGFNESELMGPFESF